MNLKNKLRKFFTLSRRHEAGFTLVELIVVIAILAILGGVAVPVYSGYVKKSELAADEALLKEINTAFASACAINGKDAFGFSGDIPRLAKDSTTGNIVIDFAGSNYATLENSFKEFFDAEGSQFKVLKVSDLVYLRRIGGFGIGGRVTGKNYNTSASEADVIKFINSIYGNTDIMTVEDLLGNVDDIVKLANSRGISVIDVNSNEDFLKFYNDLLKQAGNPTMTPEQEQQAKYNALVMYAAQASAGLKDNEDLSAYFTNGAGSNYTGTTDAAEDVAATAMKYAVGMAFVRDMNKTKPDGWTEIDPNDYDAVMDAIKKKKMVPSDDGAGDEEVENPFYDDFQAWFAINGESAMDGYFAAMGMLDENRTNLSGDQTEDLLTKGYGSEKTEFDEMIDDLLNGEVTP